MHKIILFLLALMMAPNLVSADFPDVAQSDVYYDAINYVQDTGIVEGYPNGTFQSWAHINRAEFTKMLVEAAYDAAEINACTGYTFPDVPVNEWYAPYVCTAKKNGVVDGYPDGNFMPDLEINFAESAKILVNTLGPEPVGLELSSGQWYTPYVNALSSVNAIPLEITDYATALTRGQMAEIVYRLKENITDKQSLKPEEIGFQNKIIAYYDAISFHNFDAAYAMKLDADVTLEEFKALYADFPMAGVWDFVKVSDNVYSFNVVTVDFEDAAERYAVTMEVVGDKLKTLSSEKVSESVLSELVYDDSLKAQIKWSFGKYLVIVTRDGVSETAYEVDTTGAPATNILDLSFSESGRYLTFTLRGWEFALTNVYDTVGKKLNDTMLLGGTLYGFTSDEQHFYFCNESGMISGMAVVLNLPDMSVRRMLSEDNTNVGVCGPYNGEQNYFRFGIINTAENMYELYTYYINTDELI